MLYFYHPFSKFNSFYDRTLELNSSATDLRVLYPDKVIQPKRQIIAKWCYQVVKDTYVVRKICKISVYFGEIFIET